MKRMNRVVVPLPKYRAKNPKFSAKGILNRQYVASLPWEEWKLEYCHERDDNGVWLYHSLTEFANAKNLSKQIVFRVCGPTPYPGYPYHGEWNRVRYGARWRNRETRLAETDSAVDAARIRMQECHRTFDTVRMEQDWAESLQLDVERYFQGMLFDAHEIFRNRTKKDKAEMEYARERFKMYMEMMGSVRSLKRELRDEVLSISKKIERQENERKETENQRQLASGGVIETQETTPGQFSPVVQRMIQGFATSMHEADKDEDFLMEKFEQEKHAADEAEAALEEK